MERNFDSTDCSRRCSRYSWCCSHCLPTSRVASPLRRETLSPYLSRRRARIRSVALLVVVLASSSSSSSSSSQSDFFLSFSKRHFIPKQTSKRLSPPPSARSRHDAKNASSVFSRRMSLKTLARRGKRTETRNTETTTIVGEEHRFCLVVGERGGPGAEELCASTPDESISRLVQ